MPKRIAVITCYKKPDYVRATALREILKTAADGYEIITIKNSQTGLLRYPEVLWKVMVSRLTKRPVMYILTFRGYEMLLPLRLLTVGRPFVFDEFINAEEWLLENKLLKRGTLVHKLFSWFYKQCLRLTSLILADTNSHADFSSELSGIDRRKYIVVPVGTDEDVFVPASSKISKDRFDVFYYSAESQPLHGNKYICEAATDLARKHAAVHFTIVGGGKKLETMVQQSVQNGANIDYISRVPYQELATMARKASLCLGGPFGDTIQSQYVITGKTYQFMASAKPVVIGRNNETSKQPFKDKSNCLVVKQASTKELAVAIAWSYNNKSALRQIGKGARQTFEENFSAREISKSLRQKLSNRFSDLKF